MDYNNILIQSIKNKFCLEIIGQFGICGESNFFIGSQIGKKLKELFNKLNEEYKKLMNNDLNAEYYLFGIRRKIYLGEEHQILDDKLIELLNEKENEKYKNIDLINSFNEIINFICSIPYIEKIDDCNDEFLETYNFMKEILDNENTDVVELESGISYFEELKNNFRGRNQQAFEYYDNLQEKYFQILESNFGVKYDNVPDKWI